MPLNFSSSSSLSLLPPHLSPSNYSSYPLAESCFRPRKNIFIITGISITSLLLLPLYILVLRVGHQRWRKLRSVATASMSHSDFFTYNMIAMEVISIVGNCFTCGGVYADVRSVMMAGLYMIAFTSPGQTLFHILTCVERYLAVVHPITYLGLRQSGGVRNRNIITGCVWVLCFLGMALTEDVVNNFSTASSICLLAFSFIAVSFCSLSVLCVLIRPRPGDGGGERERVDQLKQRAVNTIVVILGALLLRFVGNLACMVTYTLSVLQDEKCLLILSSFWFSLPSSLVLPLLFLHRAGKLPCCRHHVLRAER